MKRAKSAAVKRPAAADDHLGPGPLKRPAKTSGTAGFPRLPRRETEDVEEDCPLSGEIPYYDSTSGRGSYQENAERVKSGNGLILVARDSEGYKLGEVLYQISDAVDHQTGIMVEGSYLFSSAKVGSNYTNVNLDNGRLLHLCKRFPCGFAEEDPTVLHVGEWKAFTPTAVSEPWVGPKAIHRLMQDPKKARANKAAADLQETEKGKAQPGSEGKDQGEVSDEEPLPTPPAARGRVEPIDQPGAEADVRLGRLKAKLDTVLGKGKSKKEEDNKGTPVIQPSLEQLREALKKKKDVLAKKSKPKTSGSTSLLQKLAAKAQASSETPSRSRELLPLAREDHDRHKEKEDDIELPEEPQMVDGKKTVGLKDKKPKKKVRRKKDSSSESSDRDEVSEDGELELFGSAGRGTIGLSSKLERLAARRPGKLLQFTLETMQRSLTPGSEGIGDRRPPIMFQYLQQALCSRHRIDGRNQKELATIALASDHILKGNLERGLDVLVQRFKRIEAQATGVMDGATAERLEITPRLEVSSLSPEEREEAVDLERRWQRYQRREGEPSRSPNRTYH